MLATTLSASAAGQTVTDAPPAIAFPEWKEVGRPEGSIEYLVTFPSAISTPHPVNNSVPLRIFLPEGATKPVPAVLVTHYWGATDLRVERALATELNRNGIAAAVLTLPYHLARTPSDVRSGELAIEPDPAKMIATATQAVLDIRRSIDYLDTRPEIERGRVGLFGTSLGAVLSSIAAAVEPRITHGAFMLGGADLAHILWDSSLLVPQREVLRRRGYSESRLREELASIEPAAHLARRSPPSSFVIGGRFDTVIPRSATERLLSVLPNAKVLWLDTGHYGGIFVQRRLMREVARYFQTEFAGNVYTPPAHIYAPTIRIGAIASMGRGLNLGVGLDLFRADRRGDVWSSLFVSPRGPEVFFGLKLKNGFAVGATVAARRSGIGLLWSAVL